MRHKLGNMSLLLFPFILCSCGGGSGLSTQPGESSDDYQQVIYNEDPVYDYELVDDAEKGRAIYPDEAYRILREIEAHNKETGYPFFESGYSVNSLYALLENDLLTDYLMEDETYIPGSYYYYEQNDSWLVQKAEGYFSAESEFFHGFYDNSEEGESYYTSSSVEEMVAHESSFRVSRIMDRFLSMTDKIAETQLKGAYDPTEIDSYTSGEGSLYINIYRTYSAGNTDVRYIYRIIYENYLPVFVIDQKVDNILGDVDYRNDDKHVRFRYEDFPIEEDPLDRFKERRD